MKNIVKIKNQMKSLFHNGFFHILLGGTLSKVIAFFSSIIIVRFVHKTEYAYLAYSDNIYSYVYLITGLGLDSAILKYCVSDDKEKNKSYLKFSLEYGMLVQILVVGMILVFINLFPMPFPEAKTYMYILGGYPFLYFLSMVLQAFMRARLKNREYAYMGILQTGIVLGVSLVFVFPTGAFSVIIARYIALIIVIFWGIKVVAPELKNISSYKVIGREARELLFFGFSMLLANVFSMIMPINEGFLVNNLIRDTTISANYKVANLIPQQVSFVTSALITYYFPYFARMNDKKEIWKKSKKIGAFTFGLIVTISMFGILISPILIRFVYGNQYSDIGNLTTLLWIMHSLNAGFRMLPMNILPALGYTKFNVLMSIAACIIHIIIDYFCILNMGINGVAVAGCTVYLITGLSYWFYLRKKVLA